MKYTPLDVRHQEFPGGMGGYRKPEVRSFLNDIADDLEELLQVRQRLQDHLQVLETRQEEYRRTEDDLRRAVVGAERISQELRENARREAELITSQAESYRDGVIQQVEARSQALEAQHQARSSELENLYLARNAQLEADSHARFSELEGEYRRRHHELEAAFSARHGELSTLMARAQQEHAQFLAQYRALVGAFSELAARHPAPDPSPLPGTYAAPERSPQNQGMVDAAPQPAGLAGNEASAGEADPDEEQSVSPIRVEEQQFV